jgi:hypothetical protein
MTITAQSGVFGFGAQNAKGGTVTTWYRHRASDIDLGSISDDRLGPPEVGGIPTPTIPYRAGFLCSGGALINPRLENTLGWLLYGALGSVNSIANKDLTGTWSSTGATVTGMYRHLFMFNTADQSEVKWMGFRKQIPGTNWTNAQHEQYNDCKVIALTMALPNDGIITSRVDVIGRTAMYTNDSTWAYANTYEDYQSIPIGVVTTGYLQVPSISTTVDLPVAAATVTLTNAPLDIRQERVFGDPLLNDVTVVGRSLTVDMVVKWEDPSLYRRILTGSTNATQWNTTPYVADLDIYCLSARTSTGFTGTGSATDYRAWQMRIRAPQMMYQVVGGIRLAGNQSVMMRITGTALAPASTSTNYVEFLLGNGTTQYVWPT